jgi:hypothetical protein
MKTKIKMVVGVYFFVLLTYCHQKHFDFAVPASRLCLLYELCEHGRLDVGNSIRSTPDVAKVKDKLFSDKPPGMAIAAFPGFCIGWHLFSARDINSRLLFASWAACAASSALVLAICASLLLNVLNQFITARLAFLVTTAMILGAAPFPYATMLQSHGLVVGLLSIAIWTVCGDCNLSEGSEQALSDYRKRDTVGGFCCGFALASEYTAGLVLMGIVSYFLIKADRQRIWQFMLGFAPALLTIPLYSWVTIGNPLALPYSYSAYFPEMRSGFYSIGWPDMAIASKLLFQPERGLFFWSPFLVLAVPGYFDLFRRSRRLFLLTYAVPLLHIAAISGRAWDWPAGLSLQSRYLSPILPLLAIPCAYGFQRLPGIAAVLAGYSILVTTLATLTDACPPFDQFVNPLFQYHVPLFFKSQLSPNLGLVLGFPAALSSVFFYLILVVGFCWIWLRLQPSETPKELAVLPQR